MTPMGGTELIYNQLTKRLDAKLLDELQIVVRPVDLDSTKRKVLWVQDMPADVEFMTDKRAMRNFYGSVFVSSWQQTIFNINMGFSFSDSVVIKNAIEPSPEFDKEYDDTIRLIYHPTPHRGLAILVPVFVDLCKDYKNIHLDVYSNFDIYARPELNKNFESLYEQCRNHPQITYHGSQPNHIVREALLKAHIFAYPCIWRETSCMSAMEAMTSKCLIIAPNYGALPETLANFNIAYNWTENQSTHERRFSEKLRQAIETLNTKETRRRLELQKTYADYFYNWDTRIFEWETYLNSVISAPQKRFGTLVWN